MESSNSLNVPLEELQFATHEPLRPESAGQGLRCIVCKQQIEKTYFALGDQVVCSICRDVVSAPPKGSGFVRFAKAGCVGTLAGLLGALIWYLIRVIAHIELGLVAILVGLMVGKAVYRASASQGGIIYQVLAVLITYGCISANYLPDIFQAIMTEASQASSDSAAGTAKNAGELANESAAGPVDESAIDLSNEAKSVASHGTPEEPELVKARALPPIVSLFFLALITFVLALATPVMMGIESPIGLLIVGFALWEAWKFSARRPVPITGPYLVSAPDGAAETSI